MKIKVGVAGSTPAKDSFPMFGATKKWACLHWDADTAPSHWCVAYYPEPPEWFDSALQSVVSSATASESPKHSISEKVNNFSSTDDLIDTLASSTKSSSNLNFSGNGPSLIQSSLFPLPDVNTALKVIRLQEISDLYLEVAPAVAFRLYCGKEVIHFTPVNAYNVLSKRSACWADSIYSALALLQEPDMELVQLYKQEFVSLLQQHAADRQFRSDSSNSVGDGSGESPSGGDAQGSQPAPRPLMRRRSTLSSFLGISASKPLKYSAFKDIDTGADLGGESENEASESPTAHTKKSFFSAVNKVRKLLGTRKDSFTRSKGTLHFQPDNSASGSFGDDDTAVDRKKEGEGKTGLTDNDKANRHQQQQQQQLSSRTRGDSSDESGSSKRGGAEKTSTGYSPQPGSANFLSQSLLRMHSGQSPRSPAERSTSFNSSACASVSASGTAVVNDSASELQAQVEQLLQQNRLLQQQLNNSGNSTPLPISFDNIEQTPRIAAAVQIDKPAPPPVTYTTNELTTLRAFTARTNYHQNKNAHKNAARAFSGNGDNSASNNSKKSDLQKVRNLSPSSNKVKAESSSQPVLGKVTVLDRLLSQQQQTQAYITKNAAEDAPAYEGDDYYNDTIELDPLSVVQLIELHKLHQLELLKEREREKGEGCDGGGGAAGEGSGAEEAAVPSPQSRQRRRRESAALQQGKRNAQSEGEIVIAFQTNHKFFHLIFIS